MIKRDPFELAVAEFEATRGRYAGLGVRIEEVIRRHDVFLQFFYISRKWVQAVDQFLGRLQPPFEGHID